MKTNTQEIWKEFKRVTYTNKKGIRTVPSERIWEVSNLGRVRKYSSLQRTYILVKQFKTGGHVGKRYLALANNDYKYVHRIVATAFIPNPHGYLTVDHIDGNTENNHVDNLRWLTNQENVKLACDRRKLLKLENQFSL